MAMIEVQAVLSFDQYRQGKFYQVDGTSERIQAQVYAGYFKVVNVLGENLAPVGSGADTAGDLDSGVAGPPKKKPGRPKKEVSDGQGDHLAADREPVQPSGDDASGQADRQPD